MSNIPQTIRKVEVKSSTLIYEPDKNQLLAVVKINGKCITAPHTIHHVTTSSAKGVAPRIMCTADMVSELNPTIQNHDEIIGDDQADVIEILSPQNNVKNYVIYAHEKSKNSSLRNVHRVYRETQESLSLTCRDKSVSRDIDLLAGRNYIPMAYLKMGPGPHRGPNFPRSHVFENTERSYIVLYLPRSARSDTVQALIQIIGRKNGAIAEAIRHILPDVYAGNQALLSRAVDCIYPDMLTQALGCISAWDACFWFATQFILRSIGIPVGNLSSADSEIALHVDLHDYSCIQLLHSVQLDIECLIRLTE